MKNVATMKNVLSAHWRAFWNARAQREKEVLRLLAWVAVAATLLQGLWSLLEARRGLLLEVPRLQRQAEQLHALKAAWQDAEASLAARPMARPEVVRREIDSSVAALGKELQASWTAEGELNLRGRVEFASWLRWLGTVHSEQGMILRQLKAEFAGSTIVLEALLTPAAAR